MENMLNIQQEIVSEFNGVQDPLEEYEHLLEYAALLPSMSQDEKNSLAPVEGCQSNVWLDMDCEEGRLKLRADSDTLIIRGILMLIIRVCGDQPCHAVANSSFSFLVEARLLSTFSQTRRAGINRVLEDIKTFCKNVPEYI